ncbi:hypothetical protein BH09ACT8_BH09ACT8_05490 [soil metagenome]
MQLPAVTVLVALPAVLALGGCIAKTPPHSDTLTGAVNTDVAVTADETGCHLDRGAATTGNVTFHVTNSGSRVTEFYVYTTDNRVMDEVENIAPGQSRQLIVAVTEPGTYHVSCRPGMTGTAIRTDFTVTAAALGDSPKT